MTSLVFQTGRSARIGSYTDASGLLGDMAIETGIRASVGAPISVTGKLWGVMIVASRTEPLPADTEERLAGFTELAATAIANAEAQAEVTASRARIVAAADQARRRIERDLHDGAQQRLVSLALQLRAAQAAMPPELGAQLDRAVAEATGALDELREIAHGIHPAILAERGLAPTLKTLARRSPIPVDLQVQVNERLPEPVEVSAYYVIAEALANAGQTRPRLHGQRPHRGRRRCPPPRGRRRRCRGRRLHPRHRPGRPQGPGGGTRRPDLPRQPARGGDQPARGTPARRLQRRRHYLLARGSVRQRTDIPAEQAKHSRLMTT